MQNTSLTVRRIDLELNPLLVLVNLEMTYSNHFMTYLHVTN